MKHHEQHIIAYITDTLSEKDRKAFEQEMRIDPILAEEVQAMQQSQSALLEWKDDMIEVPDWNPADALPEIKTEQPKQINAFIQQRWIKYAAAAAVLLGFLWISDLTVSQQQNGWLFSFGAPTQSEDIEQTIEQSIQAAMAKYDRPDPAYARSTELVALNNALDDLKTQLQKIDNKKPISAVPANLMSDIKQLIQSNTEQQNEQFTDAFEDLIEYIDDKRADDYRHISDAMTELVDVMVEQQEQTDAILDNIVTPVAATDY